MTGDQWPRRVAGRAAAGRAQIGSPSSASCGRCSIIVLQGIEIARAIRTKSTCPPIGASSPSIATVPATAAGVAALALLYTPMATPIYNNATRGDPDRARGIKVLNGRRYPVDNGYYGDDFPQT